MAKVVLKNTPLVAVVAISGAGAETINISTDLLYTYAGTIQVVASPKVTITGLTFSIPDQDESATIVRNSVTIWNLRSIGDWRFNGWTDNRQEGQDIVVTIPAGGGTVVLELAKRSGFGDAQHRNSEL